MRTHFQPMCIARTHFQPMCICSLISNPCAYAHSFPTFVQIRTHFQPLCKFALISNPCECAYTHSFPTYVQLRTHFQSECKCALISHKCATAHSFLSNVHLHVHFLGPCVLPIHFQLMRICVYIGNASGLEYLQHIKVRALTKITCKSQLNWFGSQKIFIFFTFLSFLMPEVIFSRKQREHYHICFSARHVTNILMRSVSVQGTWQTFLSDLFQCQACGKHFVRSVSVPGMWQTFLSDLFQCQACDKHFYQNCFNARHVANNFLDLFQCQACGKHLYQICFSVRHVANIFNRSVSVPGMWQTFLSELFQCQACGKHFLDLFQCQACDKHFHQNCFSARHVADIFITLIQCISPLWAYLSHFRSNFKFNNQSKHPSCVEWKKILRNCPLKADIKTHSSTRIQICHTAFLQSAGFLPTIVQIVILHYT